MFWITSAAQFPSHTLPVVVLIVIVRNVIATVVLADLVGSAVEVAVIVAVAPEVSVGVNTTAVPEPIPDVALSVPAEAGFTERFTVFVNAPVPATIGVQLVVCASVMDKGLHTSDTLVIEIGTAVTVILALPDLPESCAEVATHREVPTPLGVSTPDEVIVPFVAAQVTAELNAPVPVTTAVHIEVCAVVIDVGDALTLTEVIVTGTDTTTVALPDLLGSSCEVAVTVAVPTPVDVSTPEDVIVPSVVAQFTPELIGPTPVTTAEQAELAVVEIDGGKHETVTEVIVEVEVVPLPLEPPQPESQSVNTIPGKTMRLVLNPCMAVPLSFLEARPDPSALAFGSVSI